MCDRWEYRERDVNRASAETPPVWAKFFGTSHPSQLRGCGPCAPSMPNPAPGRTRYTPTDNDGLERSHPLERGGATVALTLKAQTSTLGARAISFFLDDDALTPMELTVGYSSRRKAQVAPLLLD